MVKCCDDLLRPPPIADVRTKRHPLRMQIRSELPDDTDAISSVVTAAFLEAEHSGGNEARIVAMLRNAEGLTVSLVATENNRIVGHVAFSPVTIDGRSHGWFGLGPVTVTPSHQRNGWGSALIEAGLAILRERGSSGCVVLGDPNYYGRFGFTADPDLYLAGVPSEYFQRLSFDGERRIGEVNYHPAFGIS
jgi:putative acetyltransferase